MQPPAARSFERHTYAQSDGELGGAAVVGRPAGPLGGQGWHRHPLRLFGADRLRAAARGLAPASALVPSSE